jgi:hypothetical protein
MALNYEDRIAELEVEVATYRQKGDPSKIDLKRVAFQIEENQLMKCKPTLLVSPPPQKFAGPSLLDVPSPWCR